MLSSPASASCVIDLDSQHDIAVLLRNRQIQAAEMTLPDERYRAIRNTRLFLGDLLDRSVYPRVPREVRTIARQLLKHYPGDYDLDRLAEKAPDVIIREMEPLTRLVMTYEENKRSND
jgi:hypothetical protein